MPRYNVEGVVLKSINYKDSDKIYSIITKDRGKISAHAKGVRKISSRRGGNLDTLNQVVVGIAESASGYKTITEVSTISSFAELKKSLDFSTRAFYILELIHRFMEEDEESRLIYKTLISTLTRLSRSPSDIDSLVVINAFEIRFMALLGYEITLDSCVNCGKEFSEEWTQYKFNISKGGMVCNSCNTTGVMLTKGAASVLNSLHRHKNGEDISKRTVKPTHDDVRSADELIKFYVKEMLEDSFRTVRVFGSI